MAISPEALRFDADCMWVDLSDGRTIGVPLAWFPRLLHALPGHALAGAGRGHLRRRPAARQKTLQLNSPETLLAHQGCQEVMLEPDAWPMHVD